MIQDSLIFHRLHGLRLSTQFRHRCADFPAFPRRSQITAVLLAAMVLCAGDFCRANKQSARLKDGRRVLGELRGESPGKLQFLQADSENIPLEHVASIANTQTASTTTARGAVRRIYLVSGESFSGEIIKWSAESVKLLPAGQTEVREIPTDALAAVFQPQGTVTLVYEDFENEPLQWPSASRSGRDSQRSRSGNASLLLTGDAPAVEYELPAPFASGEVKMSFHDDLPAAAKSEWSIEFHFETQLGVRKLQTKIGSDRETYAMEAPLGPRFSHQRLRRTPGWHDLRIRFDGLSTMVLIDDAVLAAGPEMKGVLKSMRITPQTPAADARLRIDDVRITQFVADNQEHPPARGQDMLLMATGDEIYGTIEEVDAAHVQMRGKFGRVSIAWGELRGIVCRQSAPVFPPVSGVMAKIEVRDLSTARNSPPEFLIAALESATPEAITCTHPLLGQLNWPWARIQEIEPRFAGDYRLLFPGIRHLGDEVREQFRRPRPDGQLLSVSFSLEELPETAVFITLRVAQLEAAGPQTPPGSPFLEDLRAGQLTTTLSINGHSLGTLNERINFRVDVDKPDRLRIPVPVEVLRVGDNTLEIRQRPGKTSTSAIADFDDCEISRISLEIESRE